MSAGIVASDTPFAGTGVPVACPSREQNRCILNRVEWEQCGSRAAAPRCRPAPAHIRSTSARCSHSNASPHSAQQTGIHCLPGGSRILENLLSRWRLRVESSLHGEFWGISLTQKRLFPLLSPDWSCDQSIRCHATLSRYITVFPRLYSEIFWGQMSAIQLTPIYLFVDFYRYSRIRRKNRPGHVGTLDRKVLPDRRTPNQSDR